ncbi:hypothetical protein [Flavobacterium croceum]|uniref:hypothetical protein n=1 Tax=Flavobacterium croceum TaxID=370975 RepID=UPI0024A92DAF|nr:hypothetical protein [Flavobacterium croceum]
MIDKKYIFPILFILILIALFVYNKTFVAREYSEKGQYTIGFIDSYNTAKGGAFIVGFHYYINNKKYNEFSNIGNIHITDKYIGKRFLVKYVLNNEGMSYLDINNSIPDSIISTPLNGWRKKPKWAR